jgi:hypothetical protein
VKHSSGAVLRLEHFSAVMRLDLVSHTQKPDMPMSSAMPPVMKIQPIATLAAGPVLKSEPRRGQNILLRSMW